MTLLQAELKQAMMPCTAVWVVNSRESPPCSVLDLAMTAQATCSIITASELNGPLVLRHELGHSLIAVGEEYDGGEMTSTRIPL